jgi:hypothetical protein
MFHFWYGWNLKIKIIVWLHHIFFLISAEHKIVRFIYLYLLEIFVVISNIFLFVLTATVIYKIRKNVVANPGESFCNQQGRYKCLFFYQFLLDMFRSILLKILALCSYVYFDGNYMEFRNCFLVHGKKIYTESVACNFDGLMELYTRHPGYYFSNHEFTIQTSYQNYVSFWHFLFWSWISN